MSARNQMVGKLMACYLPHEEPKVVIVLGVSHGGECLVKTANKLLLTGSRIECLREFDCDEFERAYNEYWRDEYARRSSYYATLAREKAE